ncbi:hypothetical protein [Bradyrhizobium sp. BWA-3-5]|uniref:hypothetical protein n=1 Tax=Bradyrhizobium sp. BWA-3-5 TaxID=3080013 RepID=UPI00293E5912|nr:hypothetical protein [Bradyrhizobium sp. BWA-3-5]WOH63672.1 hypothetical protein RX331_23500 [Bradyrhizobium sp. BWA-3-5]
MKFIVAFLFLTMTFSQTVFAGDLCKKWLSSSPLLSEEPQDTAMAANDPDCYAWRLFVALNWPAATSQCIADTTRRLGDSGPTVWESWRSKFETYLDKAEPPKPWNEACTSAIAKVLAPSSQTLASLDQKSQPRVIGGSGLPRFLPPAREVSTARDEEVRLNKDTYEFIRSNKLYDLGEQEKLAQQGVKTLVFPLNAKEVKSHWAEIEESDKPRYHWATANGKLFGLVAISIITRDLPRWFWATWEHADNEKRWPDKYFKSRKDPGAFRGWVVSSIDSISCPSDELDCGKIPAGFGLQGTKWENYRLRGTQTDWVDHRGAPTILVNSKIEGAFDQRSSCISCHALAVKGASGGPMPLDIAPLGVDELGLLKGYVGPVPAQLFEGDRYLGLDFVWSLRCARRKGESGTMGGCKQP